MAAEPRPRLSFLVVTVLCPQVVGGPFGDSALPRDGTSWSWELSLEFHLDVLLHASAWDEMWGREEGASLGWAPGGCGTGCLSPAGSGRSL